MGRLDGEFPGLNSARRDLIFKVQNAMCSGGHGDSGAGYRSETRLLCPDVGVAEKPGGRPT